MKAQGILGSVVLTVLLVFCLLLIARETFAQVDTETLPEEGKVEVIYPADRSVSYRDRRSTWATTFGINTEQILPDKFRSRITNGAYEDTFYDQPVSMIQAQLGTKLNFGLGALGASVMAGYGETSDPRNSTNHSLTLKKYGLGAQFIMDNLFSEPYFAPYIEGQLLKFGWQEKRWSGETVIGDITGETGTTSAVAFGVLIQLNWIDRDAAWTAHESSGLNNTFLDLFVSQYNTSDVETDPNFQTGINYGGGLRLEF